MRITGKQARRLSLNSDDLDYVCTQIALAAIAHRYSVTFPAEDISDETFNWLRINNFELQASSFEVVVKWNNSSI